MRYKVLILELFLLLCVVEIRSQEWIRIYGDTINTLTNKVHEHYDKGYIFTGKREEGWTWFGWVMKTDINGYTRWTKSYGLIDKMNPISSSRITSDGGIIAIGGSNNLSLNCDDPIIFKINPCGEKEWCRIYNAPGCNGYGIDIEPIPGGGYMALFDRWKSGSEEIIWLFRLDSIGEVIWAQVYATAPDFWSEWTHSLLITNDTSFVITGEVYYPDPTYPSIKIIKILLIKVNLDGVPIFEVPWGSNNGIYSDGRLSTTDSKNNIYTAGRRARKSSPFGDSPCLFKTSATGEPVFYKDLKQSSSLGIATTVDWFQDSTLVQCAYWGEQVGNDTTGLIKTDSLGNMIKVEPLLINSTCSFYGSDITYNNRLILAGRVYETGVYNSYAFKLNSDLEYDSIYTNPFTYDSLCPNPITSDTITLDDCEVVIVGVDEALQYPKTTKLRIYPNPASETINIVMPKYLIKETKNLGLTATTIYHQWKNARLEVFDVFGRLMFSREIPQKDKNIVLDVFSWSEGMYVTRVVLMNEVVATAKFIVNQK